MAVFLVEEEKARTGIIKNKKRPRPSPAGPFLGEVRFFLARATSRRSAVSGRGGGRRGGQKLVHALYMAAKRAGVNGANQG
jgi:hypothetical protein